MHKIQLQHDLEDTIDALIATSQSEEDCGCIWILLRNSQRATTNHIADAASRSLWVSTRDAVQTHVSNAPAMTRLLEYVLDEADAPTSRQTLRTAGVDVDEKGKCSHTEAARPHVQAHT